MSDIFISYAREDAPTAEALAGTLVSLGWRVFVDRTSIPAGPRFDDWIDAALQETRCVLVLWSEHSVTSEWVRNEAHEGLDRNILVPVALRDGLRLPLAFRGRQARSLSGWSRDGDAPSELLSDLVRLLGEPPNGKAEGGRPEAPPSKQLRPAEVMLSPTSIDLEDLSSDAWVAIPAGSFTMGDASEGDATSHRVTLSEFMIARYPVTNSQYLQCVLEGRVKAPSHWTNTGDVPPTLERHPVVNVSWHDASAFAAWLTERITVRHGGAVQLPTEAQWEYVARGSEGRIYPWGNTAPTERHANFGLAAASTTPVDAYPEGATPLGVHDLAGNVWEWCRDWYASHEGSDQTDPTSPLHGSSRALRGGKLGPSTISLRGAYRFGLSPEYGFTDVGVRLVWTAAGGNA